jgi:UDP-3-O-[3-hydroxymyristoyl] glucosamine N-acyltransferase
VKIGDGVTATARAGVTKDIPPKQIVSGFPAEPHAKHLREQAFLRRLPDSVDRIKELEGKVEDLQEQIKHLLEKANAE